MNQVLSGPEEVIRDMQDGATIMVDGFGSSRIPENPIAALGHKNPLHATSWKFSSIHFSSVVARLGP